MEFISIGPNCMTADILKQQNLRKNAYPFDYIFSSLEIVKHSIKDKFNIFLDKTFYEKGRTERATKHAFYNEFLDTDILKQHHIAYGYGEDFKPSSGNMFNHHDLIENGTHYEQYERRCKRLLDKLDSGDIIVLVYFNCYNQDYTDLVNFYSDFASNKNIYVLGIFHHSKFEKKVLYENGNCTIYQNFDIKDIINKYSQIQLMQ
jgi:hypothetical protein